MSADMFYYETQAQKQGLRFIFGVDEAGRGPLAGPVVAAAVCLKQSDFSCAIDDSKKMSPRARENAFHEIFDKAYVGIGIVSEIVIDSINILNASHIAMEQAVGQLMARMPQAILQQKDFKRQVILLIDGNRFKSKLNFQYKTIIGGDGKSLSIACASIVAKVYRDHILNAYDKVFPQYGFFQHKGYPTQDHCRAIKKHGPCLIHRRTFNGVLQENDN